MIWKRHQVDLGGERLLVHERPARTGSKERPAPVPLVLLHGFTGCGQTWESVAEHLPFVRILAPDLPGHGGSVAKDENAACQFERAGHAVAAALERLGAPRFNLAGYSMGGRLALHLAIERPACVDHLALESASPGLASADSRRERRAADAALACFVLEQGIAAFVERWEATPVLAEQRLAPHTRRQLRAQRLLCRPEGLAASLIGMGLGSQPYLGDRLNGCHVPVLLIVGEGDAKFREIAAGMRAGLPWARIEVVPNAGHNVHLECPRFFARLVAEFAYPEHAGTVSFTSTELVSKEEKQCL